MSAESEFEKKFKKKFGFELKIFIDSLIVLFWILIIFYCYGRFIS